MSTHSRINVGGKNLFLGDWESTLDAASGAHSISLQFKSMEPTSGKDVANIVDKLQAPNVYSVLKDFGIDTAGLMSAKSEENYTMRLTLPIVLPGDREPSALKLIHLEDMKWMDDKRRVWTLKRFICCDGLIRGEAVDLERRLKEVKWGKDEKSVWEWEDWSGKPHIMRVYANQNLEFSLEIEGKLLVPVEDLEKKKQKILSRTTARRRIVMKPKK